jgi:hypothetical protein
VEATPTEDFGWFVVSRASRSVEANKSELKGLAGVASVVSDSLNVRVAAKL